MATAVNTEVQWFKTEIIPKLLKNQKLINVLPNDTEKFHIENIKIQFIGSQEAFMLTKCYRAHLTYEFKCAVSEISFFVKRTPPIPPEIFEAINFKALFTNEKLAYEIIVPTFEEFGKNSLNTAKFYYANLNSNEATLITEDFGINGWRVTNDKFNLSLDHAILAVKYLANFHAVGFAMLATDRKHFEEITQGLMESRYATDDLDHRWGLTLTTGLERCINSTKKYQKHIPEDFLKKYKNLFENPQKYCRDLLRAQEPYVTLCHGDYLRNNVAYKYDPKDEGKPTDIMMFDLQTLRISSPMLDFSVFLALSTFAEVRYKNFKEIFETYYMALRESYEKITGLRAPEFLSYEPLLKEYIRLLPYSLYTCSSFLMELVAPHGLSTEELLNRQVTDEDIIKEILSKGGEIVDLEFAHQMKELYELSKEWNVDIF
ncbi:juvenile hormone-inducible protein 26 [Haematobia irritans]|uniref:juvenile hormone-inducible protein 26 n=1 Tax=Haematobia irritans TaxID=7368 RepID=UPI003F50314C